MKEFSYLIKSIILLAFLLNSKGTIVAQQLDWDNIDLEILNEQIKPLLNAVRAKKRVDAIKIDPNLLIAAKDHSDYMASKGKLGHYQKTKLKKNPQQRILFYGGYYSVSGENVQSFNINYPVKLNKEKQAAVIDTYERLARHLVDVWVNSPPHYKNIIDGDFEVFAVNLSRNKDGEVFATQLFGSNPFIYPNWASSLTILKPLGDKRECKKCRKNSRLGNKNHGVYVENDSIFFFSDKYSSLISAIGKRSQLGADIVVASQFECGSGNSIRGEGQCGVLLPPVPLKAGHKHPKGYYWIYLGKVPEEVNSGYAVNLAIIEKNKVCKNIMYFPFGDEPSLQMEFDFLFTSIPPVVKRSIEDTLRFKIRFKKASVDATRTQIDNIADSLKKLNRVINQVKIVGFASVEGSEELNTFLMKNRANLIIDLLKSVSLDSIGSDVITEENYGKFNSDLLNTEFSYLTSLSKDSLKSLINSDKNLLERLEPFLSNHRYAELTLLTSEVENAIYSDKELIKLLELSIGQKDWLRASELFMRLYKSSYPNNLEALWPEIEITPENVLFVSDWKLVHYLRDPQPWRLTEAISTMKSLLELNPNSLTLNTNFVILKYYQLYATGKNRDIDALNEFLELLSLKKGIDPRMLGIMQFNALAELGVQSYWDGNDHDLFVLLDKMEKNYKKLNLNNSQVYRLSQFFYACGYRDVAFGMLEGIIRAGNFTPEMAGSFTHMLFMFKDGLKEKEIQNHLRRMTLVLGEDYCKTLKNGLVNFQVLSEPVFKATICEHCINYSQDSLNIDLK